MGQEPKPLRTLGFYAIAWIETFLVHGPGDVQGQKIELDDEFAAFILRAYELDEVGARRVRRAFLSRPKGRSKSGLAAMIVCFEALGECRFDHWAEPGEVSDWGYEFEPGEPVGRQVTYAEILNVATEEGQAGHTYDGVHYMLHRETCSAELLDRFGPLDVGLTRTFLPDSRGFIEPVSASNESKDGGKSTFIVADEALALDTPLPTPGGWTTMGAVQAGDELIGSDGRPVRVLKATEVQQDRGCYRVTFEDNSSVVASDGHLWLTKVTPSAALPRVRTTGEMLADGRKFRVPAGRAWELPAVDLPVDPYLLGYWLGDGSKNQPNLTVGDEDLAEVERILSERGIATHRLKRATDRAQRISFSRRTGFHQGGALGEAFRALPCWNNKHIPQEFLRGSVEQRTDLLRGLMDADGHIDKSGRCVFMGAEKLAGGVVELLRSLGQVAQLRWVADVRSRDGGWFKVHFTPRSGLVPFALPRKAVRVRDHRRGADWVTIKSIQPAPSVPVRCVAVDADDHLFAAGDGGHLTHNTHLWIPPGTGVFKLGRMHQTMVRNLFKRREASGWMLETSTMYAAGENSVAEGTHNYAKAGGGKLLFDHREASAHWDIEDRGQRIEALREVYGPAAEWMDLEAIADYWDDPQASDAEFRRFWLNQPIALGRSVFDIRRWASEPLCNRSAPAPTRVVLAVAATPDRSRACIGVAGAAGECGDKTLVMCHRAPLSDIAAKVADIVKKRDVVEVVLAGAAPRGGVIPRLTQLGVEFVVMPSAELAASCVAFQQAVKDGSLVHVGQDELDVAVAHARTRMVGESEYWDRRDVKADDSPLVACSAALYRWGLQKANYNVLESVW